MIFELTKSVKAMLYERLESPFWGAVFVTFCIRHWRIPVALLASDPHKAIVQAIENAFLKNGWVEFLILALFATAISIISPFIALIIAKARGWAQRKHREEQKKQRDAELLSKEQGSAFRAENTALSRELQQLQRELLEARNAIASLEAERKESTRTERETHHFRDLVARKYGSDAIASIEQQAREQATDEIAMTSAGQETSKQDENLIDEDEYVSFSGQYRERATNEERERACAWGHAAPLREVFRTIGSKFSHGCDDSEVDEFLRKSQFDTDQYDDPISDSQSLNPQGVQGLIGRLENLGLIAARQNKSSSDHKKIWVLTPSGQAELRRITSQVAEEKIMQRKTSIERNRVKQAERAEKLQALKDGSP